MAFLLVFGRVFSASWSNVLQKQLAHRNLDPLLIVAATFCLLALLVSPALYFLPPVALPIAFWTSMTLAVVLDVPGNMLLVKSVSLTDLSLIGPLNAYKPVVALVLGMAVLAEIPSLRGLAGFALILAGSLFLAPAGERIGIRSFRALAAERGVQFRILSLILTAGAAVFLKQAINTSSSTDAFIAWAMLCVPIALVVLMLRTRSTLSEVVHLLSPNLPKLLVLALLFLAMQFLTLKILELMYVGYALALFQLSAILNVFFGYKIFEEKYVLHRLIGSAVMIAGAAILILS